MLFARGDRDRGRVRGALGADLLGERRGLLAAIDLHEFARRRVCVGQKR